MTSQMATLGTNREMQRKISAQDPPPDLVGEPMTLDQNGRWPFNHAAIPWFVLDSPPEGMGPYELATYCYYRRHANFRTGACFVAISTIAKKLGCSWARIRDARDWLEDEGLIRVVKTRGGQPDYVVTIYPPFLWRL